MNGYIVSDQSDEAYRAVESVSQSTLKKYHGVTPEEGRYAELCPMVPSESMLIGTYVSDLIAYGSCGRIGTLPDECDLRTKAGKELRDAVEKDYGTNWLKFSKVKLANKLASIAINALPGKALIEDATHKELSIYWKDGRREEKCKGRCDLYHSGLGILTDIKTTYENLSDENLRKLITRSLYHYQLAWYRRGLRASGLLVDHSILLFLKTTEPVQVRAVRLEDIDIEAGETAILRLLETYSLCKAHNVWPGHGDQITSLLLPAYAREGKEAPALEIAGADNINQIGETHE